MHLSDDEVCKFRAWLKSCGAEIVAPTSEWEIIRVIANGSTLVAYRNKLDRQRWPEELRKAWSERRSGFQPQLGNPQRQLRGNRRGRIYELAERDGWSCWYCDRGLVEPDQRPSPNTASATVEEICPRQIGGPVHIGNQCLACPDCNRKAANKSVVEKVAMRDAMRLEGDS